MEQIQLGKQDVVFAGGGEEEHWTLSCLFDAMGALSTQYNESPELASRPYDQARDGFVIAGGGGMLVLEELEHAKHVAPRSMPSSSATARRPTAMTWSPPPGGRDTLHAPGVGLGGRQHRLHQHPWHIHASGDVAELKAVREVFGDSTPAMSSTKSLTGHSLGATGVQETIYSLLMMENDFIAASANVENLDEQAAGFDIVTERRDTPVERVLSNSFGFGGTNACLVLQRYRD